MPSHSAILHRIQESIIVPIVRTPDAESAVAAVDALIEGGLTCVEITMTVANALAALESVADRHGDTVLLGAGTVLDPETARACMLAGAQFFVTPSLNPRTVELVRRYSRAVFPGALTPTEIVSAWECGADAIKVFPCQALGGPKYIKALKAPFPHIQLFPTGGVNLDTTPEFIAAGSFAVGVGGELCDARLIAEKRYDDIAERARRFREVAGAARRQPI
ncbi:MAG: bifunctional 4-hydroxy-2-oxoglutarate aldolase/2-dehydro-3-deoxy-phosphogluconate aldolase [Acidobacteriaceae bacterium]|nr:bifunctional 4-hydroxy-2-oxoglutarate aldolase/2-dehydro-3-deoxy-phosphogluconate aldolase [Acidobacteriaceae bacterium]